MDEIKNELNTHLKDINLKVNQSFTLYEIIGTKDKEFIKIMADNQGEHGGGGAFDSDSDEEE